MLKNSEHIEAQIEARNTFYTSVTDEKAKFEWTDVPFKQPKPVEVFDRKKAWEEAPVYDLQSLKQQLGK